MQKMEKITKPILKELRKRKRKSTKEQEDKMVKDICLGFKREINNNQLPKDLRELQKAANKKGVINVNSDECFIDFDETSNSMNLFDNYESYRNKIDANNSKIKNLYRRSFKKGDNPVSKMYRISKELYEKKNNTPCNLKNFSKKKNDKSCS